MDHMIWSIWRLNVEKPLKDQVDIVLWYLGYWWVAQLYIILDRIHHLFHFLEYLLDLQWWRFVVSTICPLLYFYFLNLPGKIMNGSNWKNLRLSSTTGSSVRIRQVQSVVQDFGPDFQNDGKSVPHFKLQKCPELDPFHKTVQNVNIA